MSGSSIQPEFIQAIAESLGIETTKEAQRCLSLDLEYKIRDIVQVRDMLDHNGGQKWRRNSHVKETSCRTLATVRTKSGEKIAPVDHQRG
jgi:hypothetical protein